MNASIPVRCAPSAPRARRDLGMAVEHQRRVLALHDRRQRLDAIDQLALAGGLEPKQHRRDVGRLERAAERAGKGIRLVDGGVTR